MAQRKTILITGATGRQGGAVLRHLLGADGFELHAMTRNPQSAAARELASRGVLLVKANLDDAASLRDALDGVWGVFAVQDAWEHGVAKEEDQGKRLATLAREAGVQHYVYSSVGSADRRTGIPHFESKWHVERAVRQLNFLSHVILRPTFFMENLTLPMILKDDRLGMALKPETVVQMVAVDDVGRLGARAFIDAEKLNGREIEIAGDEVAMGLAATLLGEALGRRIKYVQYPIEAARAQSKDNALMLEWLERVGFSADIDALNREFFRMTRLSDWALRNL